MREIRFRAWYPNSKIMEYNLPSRSDGVEHGLNDYLLDLQGYYELMQYTGQKDKNGVEIWEGDIIKTRYISFWHSSLEENRIGQIYWSFPEAGMAIFWEDAISHGRLNKECNADQRYGFEWKEYEVTGNIYKNPELRIIKDENM